MGGKGRMEAGGWMMASLNLRRRRILGAVNEAVVVELLRYSYWKELYAVRDCGHSVVYHR